MAKAASRLVAVEPGAGELVDLGGLGVHFKVRGAETGGSIAVVEHPMEARRLVPPHTHTKEDELSYVIEGTVGARIGDEIALIEAGGYVFKPRGVQHTFWNPTDKPARLLEMIVPAGFDEYFAEIARFIGSGGVPGSPEHQALSTPYGLELSGDWIPELKSRYGLKLLGEP
jgi:quercetin dioxygenase-like cupin family protein